MSVPRSSADWEKVETQYRAGVQTLREIAKEHGITEGAIRKRAKRDGWERDLSAKIVAKAESLVRRAEVRDEVRNDPSTLAAERGIVEANAQVIADAVLHQRRDVQRARGVVQKLFAEMDGQVDGVEDLERLGELLANADEDGANDRLNALYRKIIAFPSRVDSTRKLAESLRVLVELERKVLRIRDDTSLEDAAKRFGEGAAMSAMDAYMRMCNDVSAT